MKIVKATKRYEAWLRKALEPLELLDDDLALKHGYMADDIYKFMRATYYRWAQCWADEDALKSVREAPTVLSVGDLHTENFGSWRDIEARLVWGINDFDEAYPLPYTADLVRLTASAWLALDGGYTPMSAKEIGKEILGGYRDSLEAGGRPVVLAEERRWLQELVSPKLKDADHFWDKMRLLPKAEAPESAREAIDKLLPEPKIPYRTAARTAGVGSLGRPRYAALMTLSGAYAAREAKRLVNSAATLEWLDDAVRRTHLRVNEVIDRAVRSRDPYAREINDWSIRRLSPDYVRVDLDKLKERKLVEQFLYEMGWETANIHLCQPKAAERILEDLDGRGRKWLGEAADRMLDLVQDDFKDWKQYYGEDVASDGAESGGAEAE